MLPDIRAVIAALLAAVGLLMISFGLVATYRAAQQQAGVQDDLAKHRQPATPPTGDRPVPIIETPGPNLAPAVEAVAATPATEPAQEAPPAEPPIGGPLPNEPETSRSVAAENPAPVDTTALQRAAAAKAKKARAARIARERRAAAAARRAAQARRARQREDFGSFGGTFTAPTAGR